MDSDFRLAPDFTKLENLILNHLRKWRDGGTHGMVAPDGLEFHPQLLATADEVIE